MEKLLETIKTAKTFGEVLPGLKAWKKSLADFYVFISFDEMVDACLKVLKDDLHAKFFHNSTLIKTWRSELENQFNLDTSKNAPSFQITFEFPLGGPYQHIVEAENRMLVICLLFAVKNVTDVTKLYQEFEKFKFAHQLHWQVGLEVKANYACLGEQVPGLTDELKSFSALSFL